MVEFKVIKSLRKKKNNTDFDSITYFGAEQRFIEALRNSPLNNLEEQNILGTNVYTEEFETDNGDKVTVKSYYDIDTDSTKKHYTLETIVYNSPIILNRQINYDNNTKKLTIQNSSDNEAQIGIKNQIRIKQTFCKIEGQTLILKDKSLALFQTDRLFFDTDNSSLNKEGWEKKTYKNIDRDGRVKTKEKLEYFNKFNNKLYN